MRALVDSATKRQPRRLALGISSWPGFRDLVNSYVIGRVLSMSARAKIRPVPVEGHIRVYGGSGATTERVRIDTQERAVAPRPVAVFLWDSKPVTLGR